MVKIICRLLIALMIWTPYQIAQAGMISTDQAVSTTSQVDRNTVLGFVGRAEVASQLQALGIDPSTAQARIAALTDQEVQSLAGRIHSAPAGADGAGVVLLVLVIIAIWWFWRR